MASETFLIDIFRTKNEFLSYRTQVKSILKEENEIIIKFESAFKRVRNLTYFG
jgi:hypothetical protein